MTAARDVPEKLYYKIGEVAALLDVKPHVLRFWESEFSAFIRPHKSKSNQRLYRRRDVEAVMAIRHLLYDRGFTIDGARRHLKEQGTAASKPSPPAEAEIEAAVARTRASMDTELARARRKLVTAYEKKLMALQSDIRAFVRRLNDSRH